MSTFWTSLRLLLWMTFITGVVYPLLITGIAQFTMHFKANGQLLIINNNIVGSTLIAQKFESDKYFWPRPSAIDYNPLPSGGSNLGPTSAALKKAVRERKTKNSSYLTEQSKIPSELLFASGSGLDPHISISTAQFQIERIIKARGLDANDGKKTLKNLINQHIEKRRFGFIGQPCVNVLLLNIALDKIGQNDESR